MAVRSDTVFLVGAGINVPMWDAVIAAINEFLPTPWILTAEQASHWLAWWVYAQRLRAVRMARNDVTPEVRAKNDELASEDLRLRRTIAEHLQSAGAGNELRLRQRFVEVASNHRWDGEHGVMFLSTNWDHLLELRGVPKEAVVHIHGDIEAPDCLYLPTETSAEAHRSTTASDYIARLTGTAWQAIRDARQLCIYGLSLSALDAELLWILQTGLEAHTANSVVIHVFDLGSELARIEWRLRMVCPPGLPIEFHAVDDGAAPIW